MFECLCQIQSNILYPQVRISMRHIIAIRPHGQVSYKIRANGHDPGAAEPANPPKQGRVGPSVRSLPILTPPRPYLPWLGSPPLRTPYSLSFLSLPRLVKFGTACFLVRAAAVMKMPRNSPPPKLLICIHASTVPPKQLSFMPFPHPSSTPPTRRHR